MKYKTRRSRTTGNGLKAGKSFRTTFSPTVALTLQWVRRESIGMGSYVYGDAGRTCRIHLKALRIGRVPCPQDWTQLDLEYGYGLCIPI
jgi:hypothetical protein